MSNNDYPRLCGGIFFTLILQDIQQRMSAREHYKGECDGLSDPDVLIGLIKVINPDYKRPNKSLKTKVNDYKSCKQSTGQYLPFGKTAEVAEFNNRVTSSYSSVLRDMTEFVQDFLEIGSSGKREYKLITALLDLINQDGTIKDIDCMYVLPDGKALPKSAIIKMKDVHLPAFLLGLWHFCNLERRDNKIGKLTYNILCPENGGAARDYDGHLGEGWPIEINLIGLNDEKKYVADEVAIEEEYIETETINEPRKQFIPESDKLNQVLTNPRANVHYGTGDIITDNDNMTIIKNYYGGRQDE